MKVLSAAQIRSADSLTIKNEPISSFGLMKRASVKCFEWICDNFQNDNSFTVVCGPGNNGGDGLCIAKLLNDAGRNIEVIILKGVKQSDDFQVALAEAKNGGVVINELSDGKLISLNSGSIVIDAIFGTGISRSVEGRFADCINEINNSGCEIISIDLPSGLLADEHTSGAVVNANHTLTFQCPKLAFFFPENDKYVGEFHILDIKLNKEFIENITASADYLERKDIFQLLKPRSKFSHKGEFGKSLLIAGSHGKMGAAVLAGRSCLRAGAGLLTVHVPGSGYDIMQTTLPEAMCEADINSNNITEIQSADKFDAIGVGPGIGTSSDTANMFLRLIESKKPMVIDADALNILSVNPSAFKFLNANCILTPHIGEFERLAGEGKNDFDKHQLQRKFCDDHNVVVVLKGAHTCIMVPGGKTYFNSTGNPGMAKGGSGDALTGVLLGLLSQGYTAEHAALIGVYLHGLSGDLASIVTGQYSMLCSDLIERIPDAYKFIES